jgi:murein L,D-transpeptidase YafK
MRKTREDLSRRALRISLMLMAATMATPVAGAQHASSPVSALPPSSTNFFPLHSEFVRSQLQYPRVLQARIDSRFGIKQLYRARGIEYPASEIFLRIFKRERVLELWSRPMGAHRFALLKTYPVCALAGEVGPKRRQGDNQTPEGFYEIDSFNPNSEYLLSLHVNYPNASDRVLSDREAPGGSIFIHGGCKTAGCIAVTDEAIKELYWIAVEARAAGQQRIPVHIFPARMTAEELAVLSDTFRQQTDLVSFWTNLQPGYDYFERYGSPPLLRVNASGRYEIASPGLRAQAQAGPVAGTGR